jgi:hypothetical protein
MARRRYFPKTFQTFLATSSARTTTGQGSAVSTGVEQAQVAKLDVTAASGTTPSLTVLIEESPNGSTGWSTHSSFTARSTTGSQVIDLKKRSQPFLRASWTITGTTPSFTFSVQVANDQSALQ